MLDGTGLARGTATGDIDKDIELADVVGQLEGLVHHHLGGLAPEKFVEGTLIDDDLAAPRLEPDAGDRGLSFSGSVNFLLGHASISLRRLNVQRFRLLGRVGMIGAGVNLEFPEHQTTEVVTREHPLDRLLDDFFRLGLQQLLGGDGTESAGMPGVTMIDLVRHLVPGQSHFAGIDDDDEIAGVNAGSVNGFVFPAQHHGNPGGGTAKDLSVKVDDQPVSLDIRFFSNFGRHEKSSLIGNCDVITGLTEGEKLPKRALNVKRFFWQHNILFLFSGSTSSRRHRERPHRILQPSHLSRARSSLLVAPPALRPNLRRLDFPTIAIKQLRHHRDASCLFYSRCAK